jgi:hypothetical protein
MDKRALQDATAKTGGRLYMPPDRAKRTDMGGREKPAIRNWKQCKRQLRLVDFQEKALLYRLGLVGRIRLLMNNKGIIHMFTLLILALAIMAVWFILKSHKLGNVPQFTSEIISDAKKIIEPKIKNTEQKRAVDRILDTTQESVDNYYKDRR